MRRDPHAPNGITEFLIASTALGLKERRVVRFSLNFALWGRLFADDAAFTPAQRAARWAVSLVNPFFQVKSLHDFNAKFGPWQCWISWRLEASDVPPGRKSHSPYLNENYE